MHRHICVIRSGQIILSRNRIFGIYAVALLEKHIRFCQQFQRHLNALANRSATVNEGVFVMTFNELHQIGNVAFDAPFCQCKLTQQGIADKRSGRNRRNLIDTMDQIKRQMRNGCFFTEGSSVLVFIVGNRRFMDFARVNRFANSKGNTP